MKIPQQVLTVALAKHFGKTAKPINLDAGVYNIDQTVTLHVKGTVTKSEDYESTPTCDIPLLPTMALLLEKAGFQRELCKQLLIDAMQEAMDGNIVGREMVEQRVKDIEAAMVHVRQITDALPKKPCKGPTNVAVTVEAK